MIFDIAHLVELAAADHGVVEHLLDRRGEGLGAVQDGQDRPGHVQTTIAQPDQQATDQGGVLRRSLDQRHRMLHTVDPYPQSDHTQVVGKCTPSIMIATRSSPDRSAASRSASACSVLATNLRDTADLLVAEASSSTPWPTGSNAIG